MSGFGVSHGGGTHPRQLHPDTQALRDYVTAGDEARYDLLPQGVVMVGVTHSNLKMSMPDIRLDLHMTIASVKEKLYTHSGTKPHFQRLVLKDSNGQSIARLDDDGRMLGYYGVESGMVIHIMDEDPYSLSRQGGLEDVSKVKKYVMSDEDYEKRSGTLRDWIKEQKSQNPNWQAPWKPGSDQPPQAATSSEPPPGPESVEGMAVGSRCEIMPGARRGTVMYLGEVEGLAQGYWVGVKLDEPVGKNDGTRGGKRYFECGPKYGTFIRPKHVTVGDFPEQDLLDDSEDEI